MPFSQPHKSRPCGELAKQQWDRRTCLAASAGLPLSLNSLRCTALRSQHWLELPGSGVNIGVEEDLSFQTYGRDGQPIWRTSPRKKPLAVATGPGGRRRTFPLSQATQRTAETLSRGRHRGHRVRLRDFPNADAEIEVLLVLDRCRCAKPPEKPVSGKSGICIPSRSQLPREATSWFRTGPATSSMRVTLKRCRPKWILAIVATTSSAIDIRCRFLAW